MIFEKVMTLDELKKMMLDACDDADKHHPDEAEDHKMVRAAIEALPDRSLVEKLPDGIRELIEKQIERATSSPARA